jgi:hypothetical protein
MKIDPHIMILTIVIYMAGISTVFAEVNTIDSQSFFERIITLQNETRSICSSIEQKSLVATKNFKTLLRNVHVVCPDIEAMQKTLANIETKTNQYHLLVTEQLQGCQELSTMLTKGLENGGLVAFYLMEGNYTLVTRILDNWHESFTKFHAKFDLIDTPLEIILQNAQVFYHNSWEIEIRQFITVWAVILGISIGLYLVMPRMINSTLDSFKKPQQQQQSDLNGDSSQVLHESNPQLRRRNRPPQDDPNSENNISTTTKQLESSQSDTFFKVTLRCTVFFIAVAIVYWWDPTLTFFLKAVRHSWYPNATTTVDIMNTNRENLEINITVQIRSIEDLQGHTRMYHDKTIQTNVVELVRNLGTGIRQASTELADVYTWSKKMPSIYRRTYTRIEEKAKKAGRLAESKDLLLALSQSSDKYEELQRSIEVLVAHQMTMLPILKEQTQSMQSLVDDGRLVEIGRIIDYHKDVLMDIDENTFKVQVRVKEIIDIVSNDGDDGMERMIKSLDDQTSTDQIKSIVYGIAGAGAATTPVLGVLALNSGYAIVTIAVTVVSGPVLLTGAASMLGLGALCAAVNFNNYQAAAEYKGELVSLEKERKNFQIAMEQLDKAVTKQWQALESSQKSLNSIAQYSNQFSKVPGFTLNRQQRNAISEELLLISRQYNRMIAFHDLFTIPTDNKRPTLPSS